MKISVSFITSNYNEIETIKRIEATNAEYIHIDLMDGKFVENKNYTFGEIVKFLHNSKKPLDVHLMVENPKRYVESFATLNTEYITFHYEAVKDPMTLIELIKSYGIKPGISIKPNTDVSKITRLLPYIDQVLVMSVEPGKGGQEFLEEVIQKIEQLSELKSNYIINVDGGINNNNVSILSDLNVDQIVVGSYICKSNDYQKQIDSLR